MSIPKPFEKVVNSADFYNRYYKNLEKIESSLKDSQKILDRWQRFFPLDEKISTSILKENIRHFDKYNKFDKNISFKLDSEKESSYNRITKKQSYNLFDHISVKHFDNGEIHVYNLLNEKIKIKSICVGNQLIDNIKNIEVDGHNYQYNPSVIKTSLKGNYDNIIEIQTEIDGFDRLFTLGYTLTKKNIYNPLLKKINLKDFEFIEITNNDTYFIKKGKWNIVDPIVLDKGLEIEKGTVLNFKEK